MHLTKRKKSQVPEGGTWPPVEREFLIQTEHAALDRSQSMLWPIATILIAISTVGITSHRVGHIIKASLDESRAKAVGTTPGGFFPFGPAAANVAGLSVLQDAKSSPTASLTETNMPHAAVAASSRGDPPLSRTLSRAPSLVAARSSEKSPALSIASEWTQHAHDAQHTGYTEQVVPTPWRWKWAWNGPDDRGAVSPGKFGLPRNVQPITGGGRVYIAAGNRGIFALSEADGSVLWNRNPGGSINSTPAFDPETRALFVVSSNGTLYKLDATNGRTLAQFVTGSASPLPLAPALWADRVFFSMGNSVYAVNKQTMRQIWAYSAASRVHTPPAYSPSRDRVVVACQDLTVHAVNNRDGSRAWHVKPSVRKPGDPGNGRAFAEVSYGWPVIAEVHGYVLVKLRLDWDTMWTWSPWPPDNATIRANLLAHPDQQALFVLDLDDGSIPFVANVGHGGFGDGGYMPMGPQPVVKRFADGTEVVYTVIRGHIRSDGRGDSSFGEMVLDDTTVPGFQAGDVRYIYFDPTGANRPWPEFTSLITDEQPFVSMAGDYLFGAHWMAGHAVRIFDRSPARGRFTDPITTATAPHVVNSSSSCDFSVSHYCPTPLTQDGDPRVFGPDGFYIYHRQPQVYDRYWSGSAAWVVSNGTLYFLSTDGAVVALEHAGTAKAVPSQSHQPQAPMELPVRGEPSSGPDVIFYDEARHHASQVKTVRGRIQYVFDNAKAVYLGFKRPHQGAFKVRILKEDWNNFPTHPASLYRVGQVVEVTGKIEWYQGDPVIYARQPDQVKVLKGGE